MQRHHKSNHTDQMSSPEFQQCPNILYLERSVFPVLLPGLDAMLREALKHQCPKKEGTTFNGCDFLTEWLYNKNEKRAGNNILDFHKIPFVRDWLSKHPRPAVPIILQLTDEQAALLILAFWRGYKICARPDMQELRQWQKKLREENRDVVKAVQESRVGSELNDFVDEFDQHGESGVSNQVVSPTPYNTPAPHSALDGTITPGWLMLEPHVNSPSQTHSLFQGPQTSDRHHTE